MWNRIAEFNWRQRWFRRNPENPNEVIEGTNGATPLNMFHVNEDIKKYLSIAVEMPVFGAAVLAILVIGEKNFWSRPVNYMTEPIASIGQWGSIVGTGLAVIGSMFVVMAREADDEAASQISENKEPHSDHHEGVLQHPTRPLPAVQQAGQHGSPSGGRHESSPHNFGSSLVTTFTRLSHGTFETDAGNRRKFAGYLSKVSDYIGTPSRKRYDVSEFQQGPAMNYPEVPGETNRNEHLRKVRQRWPTPSIREASRSGSPDSHIDFGNDTPESPQSPTSDQLPTMPRATRASTLPTSGDRSLSFGEPASSGEHRGRSRLRRDTLEVPSPTRISHIRNNLSMPSTPTIALPASDRLPAIMISSETEPNSASRSPNSPNHHSVHS
ncbi:hypothetical protein E8E14_006545 [Neopestalotiopsis sp. 37M]|nr:hypothetical protein E8E14_006545 [Neopestalotiopsis sp. 37M]